MESSQLFDSSFEKVKAITWLPWVGENYNSLPESKKLLIVGESHYHADQEDAEWYKEDKQATRCIIKGNKSMNNKTLDNISRVIMGEKEAESSKVWSNFSYYNFCQRSMDMNNKERPSVEDFIKGWPVFIEITRILKPSHCLFIGVEALKYFEQAMTGNGISHSIKWADQQIGTAYGKIAEMHLDNQVVKITGIQHAGKYFSWENWHVFVKEQIGDVIKLLNS